MEHPLLLTKFHIPYLPPSHVPRPQLVARLNEGLLRDNRFQRRLSLVSAPAGSGKTTVVTEWVRAQMDAGRWKAVGREGAAAAGERTPLVSWLTLETADNDPARFFHYLAAELQQGERYTGGIYLPSEETSSVSSASRAMTLLLNELAGGKRPFVLVLDDVHLIQNAALHEALAFLLRHQPPRLHLVLTSRGEPADLPLAHLRARQEALTLDEGDLRFTPAETATFFRTRGDRSLSEAHVAMLAERTEGWVTGLQLAALALRGSGAQAEPEARHLREALRGDQSYLADYLSEEVLAHLPPQTQRFLEQTSILERLCAPLCEAVTGHRDGERLLRDLEDGGLFLTPLDNVRRWYRYHPLFAAFLRARLQRRQPDSAPGLHRRASAWFQANDLPHEAVSHALATEDSAYALDVIERYDEWLLQQGELTTLVDWLAPIPRKQLYRRPALSLSLGWALLIQGRVEEAAALAEALEAQLPQDRRAQHLALRAGIARRQGQLVEARQLAQAAVDRRQQHGEAGAGVALIYLADLLPGEGRAEEAQRLAAEARRFYRVQNQPYMETQALYALINVSIMRGRLDEAQALCREAFQIMDRHRLPYLVGGFHSRMGLIHWERHELEEAAAYLEEGAGIARRGGSLSFLILNTLWLARTREAQGESDRSQALLDEALPLAVSSPQLVTQIRRRQVAAALRKGRTDPAERWVGEQNLSPGDEPDYYSSDDYLLLCRLLIAQGELAQARRLLRRIQSVAEQVGATSSQISALLLLADLSDRLGRPAVAAKMVEHALRLGAPGGYVQRFIEAGPGVADHLRRLVIRYRHAARPLFPAAYLERIARASGQAAPAPAPSAAPALEEPLTEREEEIVVLLGRGLSNPQIADLLHISTGTVSWHVKNVYRKLSVHNRVQAVRRAQALGVIPCE